MNDELYTNNNLTDIIVNILSVFADIITNHRDVIVFVTGFIIILAMLILIRCYLPARMPRSSEREVSHNISLKKDRNTANVCLRKDYRYDKKK